jgi:hypothetical protein
MNKFKLFLIYLKEGYREYLRHKRQMLLKEIERIDKELNDLRGGRR